MAIYIKITKVSEKGDIGFYHVSTKHGGDIEFYVGFDKKCRKIYCFLINDFTHPVRIVDPSDPNEIIGEVPGSKVRVSILARVFMKAEKVFELNEFPQYLDHCA